MSVSISNKTILLTGASGFVGRHLATFLLQQGATLRCPLRRIDQTSDQTHQLAGVTIFPIGNIDDKTDWRASLQEVDVVIHCAGRVHVMHETATDPLSLFRQVNVDATLHLAKQAALAGVKQFIFLSSIKVNGEQTALGQPFSENRPAAPQDAYAQSKYEAELGLFALAEKTGMRITTIRPPLIYGPGVGANFRSLMRALRKGLPLPLASVHNLRSFVYVGNLVDFITSCIGHPNADNQLFLISDGFDISTPDLLRLGARAFGMKARLLPCPPWLLTTFASLLGRRAAADRVCQCLQMNIQKARTLLNWSAPFTVEQGLQATALTMIADDNLNNVKKNT
jgi:nucleoside-diphosphate-sugar epimerase